MVYTFSQPSLAQLSAWTSYVNVHIISNLAHNTQWFFCLSSFFLRCFFSFFFIGSKSCVNGCHHLPPPSYDWGFEIAQGYQDNTNVAVAAVLKHLNPSLSLSLSLSLSGLPINLNSNHTHTHVCVSFTVSYQHSPPISYLTIDTRNHQTLTLTLKTTKMGLSPSPRLDIIGFKFDPSDHGSLSCFLYNKITRKSLDLYHGFIPNFDLYSLIRFGIFLAVPSWDKMRIFISLQLWVLKVRLRVAATLVAQLALEELGVTRALRLYTTHTVAYPLEWSAGFTMITLSHHRMAVGSCTNSLFMLMGPHYCCLLLIMLLFPPLYCVGYVETIKPRPLLGRGKFSPCFCPNKIV